MKKQTDKDIKINSKRKAKKSEKIELLDSETYDISYFKDNKNIN